jgi:hypothetical protein
MLGLAPALLLGVNATVQVSEYSQAVLKPVESVDAINKRQAAQPFNNDYTGPYYESPPSYPSPWGSGAGDWAAAYEKARAFVGGLTLMEKVNLTTGTGSVTVVLRMRTLADLRQVGNLINVLETLAPSLDSDFPRYVCRTVPSVSVSVSAVCQP